MMGVGEYEAETPEEAADLAADEHYEQDMSVSKTGNHVESGDSGFLVVPQDDMVSFTVDVASCHVGSQKDTK